MSGRVASVDLEAYKNTVLYTAAPLTVVTFNTAFVNRGINPVKVRLAILDGGIGALDLKDYVEYDFSLSGQGKVLERTGMVIKAGQSIMARTDIATVSISIFAWVKVA